MGELLISTLILYDEDYENIISPLLLLIVHGPSQDLPNVLN